MMGRISLQHSMPIMVCMADTQNAQRMRRYATELQQRNCKGFLTCALVKRIFIQLEVAAVDEIAVIICCLK